MGTKLIKVEVAYAKPEEQRILVVEVEENSTIETVIDRSGILEIFSEIDLMRQKVGVFGKVGKLTDRVKEGERVEIYRDLLIDPKEARRARALKTQKKK